jgi:hypothetical protein
MWASGHSADSVGRATHGYEPTREAAMAAFARSRRHRLAALDRRARRAAAAAEGRCLPKRIPRQREGTAL